jgi:hypothetical protein
LPEVIVQVDATDRLATLERFGSEEVELWTISRLRRELDDAFSGASFLPPTTLDGTWVVGLQWHRRTVLAEAEDFVHAYHRLWKRALRRFLRQDLELGLRDAGDKEGRPEERPRLQVRCA